MGYRIRSQRPINIQIPRWRREWHVRIWLFYTSLHNLETCHRLESIQKSFLEAHSYLKEYSSYGGGNIDLFCEKDEVYNSHGKDTKLKSGINVLA